MGRQPTRSRGTVTAEPDAVERTLVDTARSVFAERGYGEASLNTIAEAAGVTKGAVYYYFADKQDLFRAVFRAEQRRLMQEVVTTARREDDPWEGFHTGVHAYIHGLVDEAARRIILVDAPVALGWEEIRNTSFPSGLGLIREGLTRAANAGLLADHRVDLLATFIYGAVCEAAALVGNSEHPDQALEPVLAELRTALDRLAGRLPAVG
jgi:AcrR family transcriptional regulator